VGYTVEYYKRNREKIIEKGRLRYKNNKEKLDLYHKKWVSEHSEQIKLRRSKKMARNRNLVLEMYGNKCKCCGENRYEFIALDHIHGGGRQCRKKVSGYSYWVQILKEGYKPEKYRVLCHNCNLSIGFYGYCPHQKGLYENSSNS
jgi:hypothetical protein